MDSVTTTPGAWSLQAKITWISGQGLRWFWMVCKAMALHHWKFDRSCSEWHRNPKPLVPSLPKQDDQKEQWKDIFKLALEAWHEGKTPISVSNLSIRIQSKVFTCLTHVQPLTCQHDSRTDGHPRHRLVISRPFFQWADNLRYMPHFRERLKSKSHHKTWHGKRAPQFLKWLKKLRGLTPSAHPWFKQSQSSSIVSDKDCIGPW